MIKILLLDTFFSTKKICWLEYHPEATQILLLYQGSPTSKRQTLSFSFFFFNWRLINLQYCSGFCHTLTWISHGCTCVPHPEPPSHLPPHPIPQGHPSAPALSTLSHASNLDWWSVSQMIIYMLQCRQISGGIRLEIKCTINVLESSRNYPLSPHLWKKISSIKLVPGIKKVGDCCPTG